MQHTLTFTFVLALFVMLNSCKKESDVNSDSVKQQDTLGTGWRKIPIGLKDVIADITFFGNVGFGVSSKYIYRSTDGGNTWDTVFSPKGAYYNNSSMGGGNNVIVSSGVSNIMLYSKNQGTTFDTVSVADKKIDDIFFAGEEVAYAIGNHLWKTADAGKHWQMMYTFPSTVGGPMYRTVYFIDELKGWAIATTQTGTPGILKTEDAGKHWQVLDSGYAKFSYCSVYFVDDSNGYISSASAFGVSKTTDAGITWAKVRGNNTPNSFFPDSHFLTKDYGYINDAKHIYKTIDGGASFTTEVALGANGGIVEIFFTDESHGWACGYSGYVLKYEK